MTLTFIMSVDGDLVPQNVTDNQRQERCLVSGSVTERVDSDPVILNSVIIGDVTRCFIFDP